MPIAEDDDPQLTNLESIVLDLKTLASPSLVNRTLRHLLAGSTKLQRQLAHRWITLIGTALGDDVKLHQSFAIVFVGLRRSVLLSGSFLIAWVTVMRQKS